MDGYGKRVLVVDDDEDSRFLLSSLLDEWGYNVQPATDGLDALDELKKRHFDAVVTDYSMPGLNGIELLKRVHSRWPEIPVILVSGRFPDLSKEEASSYAYACLSKPYDHDRLVELVSSATRPVPRTHAENRLSAGMQQ